MSLTKLSIPIFQPYFLLVWDFKRHSQFHGHCIMDIERSQAKKGGVLMLKLRQIREARKLSLTDVCVMTRIDPSSLSRIEREVWPCPPGWRRRLVEAFGVEEAVLFERVEEEGSES